MDIDYTEGEVIPGRYTVNDDGYIVEPRPIVRMAPRVNFVKLAWRGAVVFLAGVQALAAGVYAVWVFFVGYPRGRSKRR